MDKAKALVQALVKAQLDDERKANDELLEQKVKGAVDVLTENKLKNIEQGIEKLQNELDKVHNSVHALPTGESTRAELLSQDARVVQNKFLRSKILKQDANFSPAEKKLFQAMAAGDKANENGGYFVPEGQATTIEMQIREKTPIMGLIRGGTSTLDSVPYLVHVGYAGVETQAAADQETTASSNTATPTVYEVRHQMFTVEAEPWITREVIQDASFDVVGLVNDAVTDAYSYWLSDQAINGDGTTEPKGILTAVNTSSTYAIVKKVTATNGDELTGVRLDFDDIITTQYDLDGRYRTPGALAIGANGAVIAALRKVRDTNGNYLWQPSVQAGQPSRFMDIPVYEFPTMPAITGTGSEAALILGNFARGYNIVKHAKGTVSVEDIYTAKKYVKYYTSDRYAGGPVDARALRVLYTKAS